MSNYHLFWAKAGKAVEATWHPLLLHMIDVSSVVCMLWNEVLQNSVKGMIAESMELKEEDVLVWLTFWAGLHDIGKATPGFQSLDSERKKDLEAAGFIFKKTHSKVHHGLLTAKLLPPMLKETGLPAQLAKQVTKAVSAHHGRFPHADEYIDLGVLRLGNRYWAEERKALYDNFSSLMGVCTTQIPKDKLDMGNAVFMLIAGLVSVADWIGSTENYFPFENNITDENSYLDLAERKAEYAIKGIRWSKMKPLPFLNFKEIFGFQPNKVQAKVIELSNSMMCPAMIIIEAPMGIGKTEAAFWLRDALSLQGYEGSYFALPTEATSNQMLTRVQSYLHKRYPMERVNLHLVHGNAALSPNYKALKLQSIYGNDDQDGVNASVVAEEWFAQKKRTLLAPFAVGTIDQALLSVLEVKHAFVRLFGLGGKTIVIDEVHAYDTYTSTLLDRLIEWLSALKAPVILLSATLPKERLKKLIEAYTGQEYDLADKSYPRITMANENEIFVENIKAENNRMVNLVNVDSGIDGIAKKLLDTLDDGGCAVWVCNTVGRAQQVSKRLEETLYRSLDPKELDLELFHARFPYDERQLIENRVIRKFDKDNNRPFRSILIATQVIEQSLDLDFDLMITDIAPVDLVLQRSGRLHRHKRKYRPDKVSKPVMWLLKPKLQNDLPDFGNDIYVYDEYILLRSWIYLMNKINLNMPEDIDYLVQQVYDYSATLPKDVTSQWLEHLKVVKTKMETKKASEEKEGLIRVIKAPSYQDDITETINSNLDEDNPFVHSAFKALTRLGESVEAICLYSYGDNVYLDKELTQLIDINHKPDEDLVRKLINKSLRLSHRGIISYLKSEAGLNYKPASWEKSSYLRSQYCLLFDEEGYCYIENWVLELNPKLGLIIHKKGGEKTGFNL